MVFTALFNPSLQKNRYYIAKKQSTLPLHSWGFIFVCDTKTTGRLPQGNQPVVMSTYRRPGNSILKLPYRRTSLKEFIRFLSRPAWEESSSLAAAHCSLVAEFVCTTMEI